ncbi:uncharacterized protein LOC110038647 isoform X2 [Phalaenopsis equestris]|uniref:uncharacterized protein LOC110038647 isoform X2 n=1 Tax=Phalaenopsis equestris TaxID=78828 RepID=UPI0009E52A18|nr:uncharacterized protein LOC110038647 isoform X2 [Phalaenopsis equestris]
MPSQYCPPGKLLASKGGERKMEQMLERKERDFVCPYASNPYHDCAEFCEKFPEKLQDEGKKPAQYKGMKKLQKDGATPTTIKALKSFNSCAGNFFSINPASYQATRSKKMWIMADRSDVHPYCENASNPYHNCAEYCFHNVPNRDQLGQEKGVVSILQRETNSCRENMSDSYIEYNIEDVPEKEQPGLVVTNSKEEKKIDLTAERWVNPNCQFASNPYHTCAEYCLQNDPGWERHGHVKKLKSLRKIVSNKETSANLRCNFASNRYHECGAECFQNKLDLSKANEGVDPKCQFASNPYHICAEYCIQNVPEMEKHGRAMKLNNQLKLKKTVSNIETTIVHRCFASNSNHACNAYFFENDLDQNIVEGAYPAVIAEEKKRNSPSEKSSYVSMENSTVNLEFSEASEVQSDYAEFSEGIAVEVVTNDLIPVETKIARETSDVQLLQLDASDLFLEWAKYCSKEKIAEFKIVKQVERRACETKNGQAHLKYYDSSNFKKAEAQGSLPLSISTSILFLLGFLFALFRWTQMIHSLCLQKGRRVMHKRH